MMWRVQLGQVNVCRVCIAQRKPTSEFDEWLHDWPWPFCALTPNSEMLAPNRIQCNFPDRRSKCMVRRRSTVSSMCSLNRFNSIFYLWRMFSCALASVRIMPMLLFDTTRRPDCRCCPNAESFCAPAFKRIAKRETIMRSPYPHVPNAFVLRLC